LAFLKTPTLNDYFNYAIHQTSASQVHKQPARAFEGLFHAHQERHRTVAVDDENI
jgi:hypothetical protein